MYPNYGYYGYPYQMRSTAPQYDPGAMYQQNPMAGYYGGYQQASILPLPSQMPLPHQMPLPNQMPLPIPQPNPIPTPIIGPAIIKFGPPTVQFGPPPIIEFGPPIIQYGPPTVQFGPPTVQFGPPTVQFGPPTIEFGPPQIQLGPVPPTEYFAGVDILMRPEYRLQLQKGYLERQKQYLTAMKENVAEYAKLIQESLTAVDKQHSEVVRKMKTKPAAKPAAGKTTAKKSK